MQYLTCIGHFVPCFTFQFVKFWSLLVFLDFMVGLLIFLEADGWIVLHAMKMTICMLGDGSPDPSRPPLYFPHKSFLPPATAA